jgi:hypothetical protein
VNFEQLIESAWNEHGDRPHQVADRLAVLLPMITTGEHVAPFARIVTHVYGEHLGQCDRGIALLEAVRRLPPYTDIPTVGGMVTRSIATLRYVGGDAISVNRLPAEERAAALAAAASALTAREEWGRALSAYAHAVELAAGLPEASPAFRALAIGGNNLSAALEEQLRRTEPETQGMVAAARGALAFWRRAGTWLEEERALYRLARSLLAAGEPVEAIEHAKACVDVCNEHEAPPFERFFAWAVLARAYRESDRAADYRNTRAQALDWFDRVPDDDREWCEADLAELAY